MVVLQQELVRTRKVGASFSTYVVVTVVVVVVTVVLLVVLVVKAVTIAAGS